MEIVLTILAQVAEPAEQDKECEEKYGVFQCSTTLFGLLFLVATYSYILWAPTSSATGQNFSLVG